MIVLVAQSLLPRLRYNYELGQFPGSMTTLAASLPGIPGAREV
jgi:hypothetical protein